MISKENTDSEGQEPRLYELGYHIIPTIDPEAIGDKVSDIREAVESLGGIIIVDEIPQLRDLAYTLSKIYLNKKSQFTSAYFGWMTFTITPEKAVLLKEKLDTNESILRFLIIKISEDTTPSTPSRKMAFISKGENKNPSVLGGEKNKEKKKEDFSEAELDKTIEELVVE